MDSEAGALASAIAIISGANPIIAGAVGVLGGIFGGWFSNKKQTKKTIERDEKTREAIEKVVQQHLEREEAKKQRQLQREQGQVVAPDPTAVADVYGVEDA